MIGGPTIRDTLAGTISVAPTAVQLRDTARLVCRIVHGAPTAVVTGPRGPIALFAPGRLVAYSVRRETTSRLYVFRTGPLPGGAGAAIAGVQPGVKLLLATHSKAAIVRVGNLLAWLARNKHDPDSLSDGFWLRTAGAIGGHLRPRARRLVPALLPPEMS